MSATPSPTGHFGPLPDDRLERDMGEWKKPLDEGQAVAEALRCLFCHDAPCTRICPTHIDIPGFIRKISTGNVRGAARTILDANILGASCARVCPVEVLCVGECVYNDMGRPPIQIGKLQRFATDQVVDRGIQLFAAGAPTGRKVALIGAGPASLACAHELRRLGHEVTLLEKRGLVGGLNTTGVAPYKMKADYALVEAEWVTAIGMDIRTGVEVGRDVSAESLLADYDAVFLGVGLGPDGLTKVPGEDLAGVVGAVELIERFKNAPRFDVVAASAVVVGGGNTALDVVRQLRRLGVPDVTMVYRRSEDEMPGYRHELAAARLEGAKFRFLSNPVAYLGDGRVEKVRVVDMALGEPDASGRRSPRPVAGSEHELPADLVVLAVGQSKLAELLALFPGVEVDRGGRVVVDERGCTGNPRVWSGGDCVNGGKEVVNAAADGKRAAHGIHDAIMAQ
ncbi:MAG: hypothetical protein AMXMBFR64_03050 [Myxococcales bacterium]